MATCASGEPLLVFSARSGSSYPNSSSFAVRRTTMPPFADSLVSSHGTSGVTKAEANEIT